MPCPEPNMTSATTTSGDTAIKKLGKDTTPGSGREARNEQATFIATLMAQALENSLANARDHKGTNDAHFKSSVQNREQVNSDNQ